MASAGKYRHLILFEECVAEQDALGGAVNKWVPRWSVWANIRQQTMREAVASSQTQSYSTYTIEMRRPPFPINASWRIKYLGEYYNIKGNPLFNAERDELTITAEIASYEQS